MEWTTHCEEELETVGTAIAQTLHRGDVLLLSGPLGAGKTTLAKIMVNALTKTPISEITSPTFSYVHEYDFVFHFDLYRLQSEAVFYERGFDEYFDAQHICLVEWPEKAAGVFPKTSKQLTIVREDNGKRKYTLHESAIC